MSDGPLQSGREGSLEAPTRHALGWREPSFYDPQALEKELERVFEICHGCRRCFNLCNAFPTLFDLVDESKTGEVDGVDKRAFSQVVDHCYLCDMCYMTKCPYVPPHPWNVDFPHLMLRAKAVKNRRGEIRWRDKVLSATDLVGKIAGIPVVAEAVNAANRSSLGRKLLDAALGVHPDAPVPAFRSQTLRKQLRERSARPGAVAAPAGAQAAGDTRGKVALFTTCYVNRNEPDIGLDLVKVFEHNGIEITLAERESCCGMPKFELGDLEAVAQLKAKNVPQLVAMIERGYDIVAPIPSCVLMFKQELPLMFADDAQVARIKEHIFDPFEYLLLRHKAGLLRTDFTRPLGKVAYHVACHLRVQNIGLKTRDMLQLIPGTTVEPIERCSGHDGTYGIKRRFRDTSMKIGRPVMQRIEASGADFYASDCPMAGHQIESGLSSKRPPTHPLTLLRMAYGL
ncbi:MAG TPA: heterodisulfide reductase-related iron-sulfur binding cluster [Steroidobacteraceae bacterium]|nr:heterodisulfide reductase-related iron-sulfur binding cluster [Steroidobacteraceae bacterium]